jgi:uncharacterized protein
MLLDEFFQKHKKVALAFSGGTDSSFLLYAGHKYGADIRAYYVKTTFQPDFETKDAERLSKQLGVEICLIEIDILNDKNILSNPSDRCYYCKRKIFEGILAKAGKDGYTTVIDGTNASDDVSDRPGMRALSELGVLSPLRICGITKSDVRRMSAEAGLFTADKPSYACLATRIPTGTPITVDILRRTECAEDALMKLGFSDFRVRYYNGAARLQFTSSDIGKAIEKIDMIRDAVLPYFDIILIDTQIREKSL